MEFAHPSTYKAKLRFGQELNGSKCTLLPTMLQGFQTGEMYFGNAYEGSLYL